MGIIFYILIGVTVATVFSATSQKLWKRKKPIILFGGLIGVLSYFDIISLWSKFNSIITFLFRFSYSGQEEYLGSIWRWNYYNLLWIILGVILFNFITNVIPKKYNITRLKVRVAISLIGIVLFIFQVVLDANRDLTPLEYIDLYKDYAITSMYKKGVPASITLAQGLLESANGNSYLARKAKNHFGVKVGGNWDGSYVLQDDDRRDEKFRKYESVLHSYEDHGDLLLSASRYAFLFKLKITDYKGWAYGLKKAGYATDPKYPRKLINVIEKYKLNEYDKLAR